MPRGTEALLREFLWEWLTDEGYSVAGEVHIDNGQIDLVGEKCGQYVGFEVKTIYKLWKEAGLSPKAVGDTLNQLHKYQQSGYLDEIYLCCGEIERVSKMIENVMQPESHLSRLTNKLGLIEISLDSSVETRIIRPASSLNRTQEPSLSRTNESWVQHHVWKWAQQDDWFVTREGLLPYNWYVDICILDGSKNTRKILQNQDQYSHIGIEVKGADTDPVDELTQQLQMYIDSGGLTHLYLAIPEKRKDKIIPDLGQQRLTPAPTHPVLSTVGIITVDESGTIKKIQEPEKVKMEYDGIRRSDQKYVPVGLGYQGEASKDDFNSISYYYYHQGAP